MIGIFDTFSEAENLCFKNQTKLISKPNAIKIINYSCLFNECNYKIQIQITQDKKFKVIAENEHNHRLNEKWIPKIDIKNEKYVGFNFF